MGVVGVILKFSKNDFCLARAHFSILVQSLISI